MNIWLLCQYAGSPTMGMNHRPYYFAKAFKERGHAVTVVSGSYSHQYQELPVTTGTYTKASVDGLEYVWIRTPKYGNSSDPRRLLSWLAYTARIPGLARLDLPKPDVIIVSSPVPYPIFAAARLARKYGARLVFEERDLWPMSLTMLGGHGEGHPFIRLTQWAEDYGLRKSDLVVSPLPNALEHFSSRGLPKERFLWISNGYEPAKGVVGTGKYAELDPSLAAMIAQDAGSFKFLYAGSFHARNSALVFIKAARLLVERGRDCTFYFLGKDGGGLDAMKAEAEGLSTIRFLQPVPRPVVGLICSLMDACCAATKASPLYRFGISLTKIYDYMAAGRPILLSSDAVGDPVSLHGCGLKVSPEDPEALADAMEKLMDLSHAERMAMGHRGREALLSTYTYEVLADRYLAALSVL